MEQRLKLLKKNLIISAFVFCAGGFSFAILHHGIRVVDFIQVFGMGMISGVLAVNTVIYLKLKAASQHQDRPAK